MTNKELLAELKVCYELFNDIRENHEGRFKTEEENIIYNMEENINKLYSKTFDKTMQSEYRDDDLRIKTKQEFEDSELIIGNNVATDYNFVKKGTFDIEKDKYNDFDYCTCEDIGYNWYLDELGYKHNNWEYDKLANGFMKALDEICELSKQVGKEFDYYDKTCKLTELSNFDSLELLDEYGSDNDDLFKNKSNISLFM